MNQLPELDEIYLYSKYPYKAKYQFWINKRESTDKKLKSKKAKHFSCYYDAIIF